MDQKSIKTSTAQRVIILIIAILLVGSMIFAYMFIVLGGSSADKAQNSEETMEELQAQYEETEATYDAIVQRLSDKYFKDFSKYKSKVKAYNLAAANSGGLQTEDLKEGTGHQLGEKDYSYDAYYIGWCSDGTVFDSSFDDFDKPTALEAPIEGSDEMIAGWKEGIVGMKLGGVRLITMNSDLGYGEDSDICEGESASPLKYIVMAIEQEADLKETNQKLQEVLYKVYNTQYNYGATSL